MANIVPQCEEIEVLLDGNSLDGDIEVEEFNVPDLEILRANANALCPRLNFELKVQSDGREMLAAVGKAAGKPMQLEIRASIKGNYGESVGKLEMSGGTKEDTTTVYAANRED